MFDDYPEQSLFEYKKMFHLIKNADVKIDDVILAKSLAVNIIIGNEIHEFNASLDIFDDPGFKMMGIDAASEVWNILKYEGLKR